MKRLNKIISTTCLGLMLTTAYANENPWQLIGDFTGTSVNSITVDHEGNLYAGTGYRQMQTGSVYTLSKNTKTWQLLPGTSPDGTSVNTIVVDKMGTIFVGTGFGFNGNVYKVSSNSSHWKQVGDSSLGPVEQLAVASSDGIVYAGIAAMGGSVYKISPATDTRWQPVVNDGRSPDNTPIWAITLDAQDNLYVGTWLGSVYKFTKGGNQWQWLAGQSYPSKTPVFALAITPNGNLFAGSWLGHFYALLKDNPQWQQPAGPMPDGNRVNALVTDTKGNVYAATGSTSPGNIFKMAAGSTQWQLVTNQSSPDGYPIFSLAIDANNNLYASTGGAHIYLVKK